ncbi:MAG: pantetheine-phosphate adenylyltransferase [Clostridia bacterium]|nr:pantetheine-phosphate adenylyltransferase [Clostridia bacterium]
MNCKRIAIVPGSFDPITNGHLDILRRAASEYEVVYLAVMINASKQYLFSIEQRTEIAKAATSDIKNVKVISSEGMLWRLAKELDADAIVKGYRNQNDYAYELEMAKFNEEHYPLAKTVLLKADPKLEKLSSTALREKLARNESIEELIPKAAAELVYKFYK